MQYLMIMFVCFITALVAKEKLNIKQWFVPLGISILTAGILYIAFGETIGFVKGFLFALLVIYASVSDFKYYEVDDVFALEMICVGLIDMNPISSVLGLLVGLPFLLSAIIKKGRCGGADIKIAAALGFVIGFNSGLIACILGMLLCLAIYLPINAKTKSDTRIPFVPFITAPGLIIYIIGGFVC